MSDSLSGIPATISIENGLTLHFILPEGWEIGKNNAEDIVIVSGDNSSSITFRSPILEKDMNFPNITSTYEMFPFITKWVLPEDENIEQTILEAFTLPEFHGANVYSVKYAGEENIHVAYFVMISQTKYVLCEGTVADDNEVLDIVETVINSIKETAY